MRRVADERGQTLVLAVAFVVLLLGFLALVIDVGSWFREQRRLQTVVDAAALAGVQQLPVGMIPGPDATAVALSYASTNGGPSANTCGVDSLCVTFPNTNTIDVTGRATAPGFFAQLYNDAAKGRDFSQVVVRAHARASVGAPSSMEKVAPIAVKDTNACTTSSCFGTSRQLSFAESNLSASSFGLIDLTRSGNASAQAISSWIACTPCFAGRISVGVSYPAVTGEKIGPVRDALEDAAGKRLLIPVFDTASAADKSFHIVGFAAFVVEAVIEWKNDTPGCRPNCKLLQGHFETYITHDAELGPGPVFGVRVVALTG